MDKVLVKLYVPILDEIYDVWIPSHKKIGNVIIMCVKVINEINDGCYNPSKMPSLYDKLTAKEYDVNISVKESSIRSGAELILI